MATSVDKPSVPDVLPLVRAYYRTHPTGGSLHIVLDDGNVTDRSVRFCLGHAADQGDHAGVVLAELLLRMSERQRRKLHQRIFGRSDD